MSYEDNNCPCGGKKDRDTMLCADCVSALAGHTSMTAFNDLKATFSYRRQAAIILVSLAKGRKRLSRMLPTNLARVVVAEEGGK